MSDWNELIWNGTLTTIIHNTPNLFACWNFQHLVSSTAIQQLSPSSLPWEENHSSGSNPKSCMYYYCCCLLECKTNSPFFLQTFCLPLFFFLVSVQASNFIQTRHTRTFFYRILWTQHIFQHLLYHEHHHSLSSSQYSRSPLFSLHKYKYKHFYL